MLKLGTPPIAENISSHKYTPHIDGLRALAILPVIIFHFFPALCPGGYAGVDVFFVISGYLITGGILSDLKNQRFSIADFYVRRIRRILPAYVALITFVMVAAFFILPLITYKSLCTTAIYSVFYATNIYFNSVISYFDLGAHSNPLLHLWSLGVEEQFYLAVPLCIWILWIINKRFILFDLFLLFGLSFIFCLVIQTRGDLQYSFYMLPCRAWELLAGAILSALPRREKSKGADLQPLLGVVLISIPYIFYNSQTRFPGASALPSVLGSVLLIRYGDWGSVGKILSHGASVAIGKVSYSLYLWHWPIYVLLDGNRSLKRTLAGVFLTAVASYISWRYIETPIRQFKNFNARHAFGFLIISSILLVSTCWFVAKIEPKNGSLYSTWQGIDTWVKYETARDTRRSSCKLEDLRQRKKELLINIGKPETAPTFVLWGDSHALALLPGVDQVASEYNKAGFFINQKHDFTLDPNIGAFHFNPRNDREPVLRWLEASPDISIILLASRWDHHILNENDIEEAVNICTRLHRAGKQVFVIQSVPVANQRALWYQNLGLKAPKTMLAIHEANYDKHMELQSRLIQAIRKGDVANTLPLNKAFWNSGFYYTGTETHSYYSDDNHLNASGAYYGMKFVAPLIWGNASKTEKVSQ